MKSLVLAAALVAAFHAHASGDYAPNFTRYKAYSAPDTALAQFQQGQLGILQPGMKRVYLYTAWRAISLGAPVGKTPGLPGGLGRADGSSFGDGWTDPALTEAAAEGTACPPASAAQAGATLAAIGKRKDATPVRVKAWRDAQELVSLACKAAEDARYMNKDALASVVVPEPLPAAEPAYWRDLRSYQRAATQFHAERYTEASALFTQIGASPDHPMRDLGHYLALRSELRRAAKDLDRTRIDERRKAYAALVARAQSILQDASLAPRHEATRATLRSARVHLAPQEAFAQLSEQLADPAADPFVEDRLGDWAVVLARHADVDTGIAPQIAQARQKYDYFNWIETMRACAYPDEDADKHCRAQSRHAQAQWEANKSRPWLVATLMLADSLTPALDKAASAVKADAPEYLTVRYHLARLHRLGGQVRTARAISDAALKLPMADGSRNLFREERFALASTIADAAPFVLRVDVDSSRGIDKPVTGLNDDVLNWLNYSLDSAGLVQLARVATVDADLRARLAISAWMRAELLGQNEIALQALVLLEPLAPALKDSIASYRSAATPVARRHQMLLAALRFGLSPVVGEATSKIAALDKEEVTASNWCRFKPEPQGQVGFPWLLPPAPALEGSKAASDELARLAPLKTATGFIGQHVLARVKTDAGDPDLPWLLHVVVASTRGGCLDDDAKQLSREAFNVLHKRYPRDAWTKKTPYFY